MRPAAPRGINGPPVHAMRPTVRSRASGALLHLHSASIGRTANPWARPRRRRLERRALCSSSRAEKFLQCMPRTSGVCRLVPRDKLNALVAASGFALQRHCGAARRCLPPPPCTHGLHLAARADAARPVGNEPWRGTTGRQHVPDLLARRSAPAGRPPLAGWAASEAMPVPGRGGIRGQARRRDAQPMPARPAWRGLFGAPRRRAGRDCAGASRPAWRGLFGAPRQAG